MDVQNTLENVYLKGVQYYDFELSTLNLPYRINLKNMTEKRQPNGPIKHMRRVQQAPYPLIKTSQDDTVYDLIDQIDNITINDQAYLSLNAQTSPALPPYHTKSKKLFSNSSKTRPQMPLPNETVINYPQSLNNSMASTSNNNSTSAKFARQIFNNLNIFSHKTHNHDQQSFDINPSGCSSSRSLEHINHVRRLSNKSSSSTASTQNLLTTRRCRKSYRSHEEDIYPETDGGSSCCSATTSSGGVGSRRPSIDTISTYLSHESADILQFDCQETIYTAEDDVFLPSPHSKGSIVGVDADSDMISKFVNVVEPPKWPVCRPCAMCLEELQHSPNNPVVSLVRCEHMMHLNCLNHLIVSQSQQQQHQTPSEKCKTTSLFIECPVCGIVYGEKYGNQPPGTMTWSVISKQLAGHEGQNTIQIVYKYEKKHVVYVNIID